MTKKNSTPADFSGELSADDTRFVSQFINAVVVDADAISADSADNYSDGTGFLGSDVTLERPPLWIKGDLDNNIAVRTPFQIVCFHTDDEQYTEAATRLLASARRFGLSIKVETIPSGRAWELNCAYKANFIRSAWRQSSQPVVWLDADATVEAFPDLFERIDADYAVHRWGGWKTASGTIYFGKSLEAGELLDHWVERCEADPATWDQIHLESAWADVSRRRPLKTVWLPRSYCHIFDKKSTSAPVITHWQASRSLKKQKKNLREEPTFSPEGKRIRSVPTVWRKETSRERELVPLQVAEAISRLPALKFPVLDVACGRDDFASAFAPSDYVGIDQDPEMLKCARAKHPEHDFRIHDVGMNYPGNGTVILRSSDRRSLDQLAGRDVILIEREDQSAFTKANRFAAEPPSPHHICLGDWNLRILHQEAPREAAWLRFTKRLRGCFGGG